MIDQDLKKLEEMAKKMETGELELEENLNLFKEGIELIKKCNQSLEKAELKVKEIIGEDGDFQEKELG